MSSCGQSPAPPPDTSSDGAEPTASNSPRPTTTIDAEHPLLFVAEVEVLERYLVGLFADDIREDLDLPLLDLPWEPGDLAEGFELTDMVRGYRTLERAGGGPLAAAPDSTLSLIALVPLSHYLGWTIADLQRSFLSPTGAPLLRLGRYASH